MFRTRIESSTPYNLSYYNHFIYYSSVSDNKIYKSSINSSSNIREVFYDGSNENFTVKTTKIFKSFLYCSFISTTSNLNKIVKFDLVNNNQTDVITDIPEPISFTIMGDYIYITTQHKIIKQYLFGPFQSDFMINNEKHFAFIESDNSYLLFSYNSECNIYIVDQTGVYIKTFKTLNTTIYDSILDLKVNNKYLFVCTKNNKICKISINYTKYPSDPSYSEANNILETIDLSYVPSTIQFVNDNIYICSGNNIYLQDYTISNGLIINYINIIGNQIYLKQDDVESSIQYSLDKVNWNNVLPTSWPLSFISENENNFLNIDIITDLYLPVLKYGIGRIIIRQSNTIIDGHNNIINIQKDYQTQHFGFIQNGSGPTNMNINGDYEPGYSNITVQNLGIVVPFQFNDMEVNKLETDSGFICCAYFSRNAQDNVISNCFSKGVISRDFSAGIVGSYAASNSGNLTIINCYSLGKIKPLSSGIIGQRAGQDYGTVTISNCYSTWPLNNFFNNHWSTGGILGKEPGFNGGTINVSNCYFNGPENKLYPKDVPGYVSTSIMSTGIYGYDGTWSDITATEKLSNDSEDIWTRVSSYPNSPWLLKSQGKTNFDPNNLLPPFITQINPIAGLIGELSFIFLYGYNFIGINQVTTNFGGQTTTLSKFITSASFKSIQINPPVSSTPGPLKITLNSSFTDDSNTITYYYNNESIRINSISPQYGTPDDIVTISGFNFVKQNGTTSVTFYFVNSSGQEINNLATIFGTPTNTLLQVKVPKTGLYGPVKIKVSNGTNIGISQEFECKQNPSISNIQVNETNRNYGKISGGYSAYLLGSNFYDVSAITFKRGDVSVPCTIFFNTGTIYLTVPDFTAYGPGLVDIELVSKYGTVVKQNAFTYAGIPVIKTISLPSYLGTIVLTGDYLFSPMIAEITGWGIQNALTNTYGSITRTVNIQQAGNTTSLIISPDFLPGTLGIKVISIGGTSDSFPYTIAIKGPEIADINPKTSLDAGNSTLTIDGKELYSNEIKVFRVKFGSYIVANLGNDVLNDEVIGSANFINSKIITLLIPSYIETGYTNSRTVPIEIYIKTSVGEVIRTFTNFNYFGIPIITEIIPSEGSKNKETSITIKGNHFYNVKDVSFNGVTASNIKIIDPTTITANTPKYSTGKAEATVKISAFGGEVINNKLYTYKDYPLPTISGIYLWGVNEPTTTPARYGRINSDAWELEVVIYGTNFFGPTVTVNDIQCDIRTSSYFESNSTQIWTVMPSVSTPGPARIKISTARGDSIVYNELFTYIGGPSITSLDPSIVSTTKPTEVTVIGNGFYDYPINPVLKIKVRDMLVTNIKIINDSHITFTSPSSTDNSIESGNADIVLETIGGTCTATQLFFYAGIPTILDIQPRELIALPKPSPKVTVDSFGTNNTIIFDSNKSLALPVVRVRFNDNPITSPEITWFARPEGIININSQTNTFTTLQPGKVTLYAKIMETNNYNTVTESTVIIINKDQAIITDFFDESNVAVTDQLTLTFNVVGYNLKLPIVTTGTGNIMYFWTQSKPDVGDFNSLTGHIRMNKAGTITIEAILLESNNYLEAYKKIIVNIDKSESFLTDFPIIGPLTYSPDTLRINLPTIIDRINPNNPGSDGIISYKSLNEDVATVDSSSCIIKMLKAGTFKIRATLNETDSYLSTEKDSETITIIKEQGLLSEFLPIGVLSYSQIPYNITSLTKLLINNRYVSDGIISYRIDGNTSEVASINSTTGTVTMLKAGTFKIIATLSETPRYFSQSKEIFVTINKTQSILSPFPPLGNIIYDPIPFIPSLPSKTPGFDGYVSTGDIIYTSSDTSIASIHPTTGQITLNEANAYIDTSNSSIHMINNKNPVIITATINENDQYFGTSVATNLTVSLAESVLEWNDIITTYSPEPFIIFPPLVVNDSITTNSPEPFIIYPPLVVNNRDDETFTYTVSNPTIATIATIDSNTGSVTMLKSGSTIIYATISQTNKYLSKTQSIILSINKAKSTFTDFDTANFGTINGTVRKMTYRPEPFAITWPVVSDDNDVLRTIVNSSLNTNVAIINSDNKIQLLTAGTVTISSRLLESDQYLGDIKEITFTVIKADTILTDFALDVFNNGTLTYQPTNYVPNSDKLPRITTGNGNILYTVENNNYANISNDRNCSIKMNQYSNGIFIKVTATVASNEQYNGASKTTQFKINKADIAISSFTIDNKIWNSTPFNLTSAPNTSDGTVPIRFTSSDNSIATVNASVGTITMIKSGTVTITASLADESRYIGTQSATFTITKAKSEISPYEISNIVYNSTPFIPDVFKPVGKNNKPKIIVYGNGTIKYSSSDPSVATIDESNGKITMLKAGTTSISVSIFDTEQFSGITSSANFTINRKELDIDVWKIGSIQYANTYIHPIPHINSPEANDNRTWTFTSSDTTVATVSNQFENLNNEKVFEIKFLKDNIEVLITANLHQNDKYSAINTSIWLKFFKGLPILKSIDLNYSPKPFSIVDNVGNVIKIDEGMFITIDDNKIAEVNSDKKIIMNDIGTTKVTLYKNKTENISSSCTITVNPTDKLTIEWTDTIIPNDAIIQEDGFLISSPKFKCDDIDVSDKIDYAKLTFTSNIGKQNVSIKYINKNLYVKSVQKSFNIIVEYTALSNPIFKDTIKKTIIYNKY